MAVSLCVVLSILVFAHADDDAEKPAASDRTDYKSLKSPVAYTKKSIEERKWLRQLLAEADDLMNEILD